MIVLKIACFRLQKSVREKAFSIISRKRSVKENADFQRRISGDVWKRDISERLCMTEAVIFLCCTGMSLFTER